MCENSQPQGLGGYYEKIRQDAGRCCQPLMWVVLLDMLFFVTCVLSLVDETNNRDVKCSQSKIYFFVLCASILCPLFFTDVLLVIIFEKWRAISRKEVAACVMKLVVISGFLAWGVLENVHVRSTCGDKYKNQMMPTLLYFTTEVGTVCFVVCFLFHAVVLLYSFCCKWNHF